MSDKPKKYVPAEVNAEDARQILMSAMSDYLLGLDWSKTPKQDAIIYITEQATLQLMQPLDIQVLINALPLSDMCRKVTLQ